MELGLRCTLSSCFIHILRSGQSDRCFSADSADLTRGNLQIHIFRARNIAPHTYARLAPNLLTAKAALLQRRKPQSSSPKICALTLLTPPSSKMGPIRPFLVFRADGRYSAFRLCARHVRSADTSRRENGSSARVCGQRPSRSEATCMRASVIAWFEPAIYESDC